jgi:hypothetical protein
VALLQHTYSIQEQKSTYIGGKTTPSPPEMIFFALHRYANISPNFLPFFLPFAFIFRFNFYFPLFFLFLSFSFKFSLFFLFPFHIFPPMILSYIYMRRRGKGGRATQT